MNEIHAHLGRVTSYLARCLEEAPKGTTVGKNQFGVFVVISLDCTSAVYVHEDAPAVLRNWEAARVAQQAGWFIPAWMENDCAGRSDEFRGFHLELNEYNQLRDLERKAVRGEPRLPAVYWPGDPRPEELIARYRESVRAELPATIYPTWRPYLPFEEPLLSPVDIRDLKSTFLL